MKLRYNDEYHAYWIDGVRCKGVTTVAKIPDDQYWMNAADRRKVAVGLALKPKLLESVAANIDDRETLDKLVEQAKEAGGANEGRDRGVTAHTLTERHDLGKQIVDTELSGLIVAGWQDLIARAGLTIIPEFIERIICYPERFLCGRLDRVVRTIDGRLAILDVKGGKWALAYPHAIAVQLAIYANAPLMAGPLDRNGETTEFEPMPDVDKEWGIIAHFPEDGEPVLADIDIAAGWKAAEKVCFMALKWRDKKNLVRPHRMPPKGLTAVAAPIEPPAPAVDEGAELSDFEIDRLRHDFRNCPSKAAVDAWLRQSIEAGHSFHPTAPHGQPSERRAAIIRAAIAWSDFDEDIVRAGLALLLGDEPQTAVSVGAVFGALTIDEARRFCLLADGITLSFRDDGSPIVAVA